ncbi:MAG: tRNA (adenosine(37)-N6)-threonylcarbamoyltransferase complex ATPase subunit type 1 TsaE [Peptococcaceae bacterium]|nr:tRNA (adenosine(37)-N6)-threonylcarbamoyltransferase complex ATPase subunit type 1 TsaE [Peptococcaceae bacterium]
MQYISRNLDATLDLGDILGRVAQPGDVYCLLGELGAGKTSLAQGIAAGLGIIETINSPTFTLIHEYQGRLPFYHMDLYRMACVEEGEELGLQEYFWGKGLCVVEWPQIAAELLPRDVLQVDISDQLGARLIELTGHGTRSRQIIEEVDKIVAVKY